MRIGVVETIVGIWNYRITLLGEQNHAGTTRMVRRRDAGVAMARLATRIHDRFPAGYITIKGEFFQDHKDEIIALINARAEREKEQRPLQRVMGMDPKRDGSLEITTTDSHIARTIAEAIHSAYKGDLKLRYSRDENLLRATWKI